MRYILAMLSLIVAVGAGLVAAGALQNLFADYKDSPDWVYLMLGLPLALASAAFLIVAVLLIRQRQR